VIKCITLFTKLLHADNGGLYGSILLCAPYGLAAHGINGRTLASVFPFPQMKKTGDLSPNLKSKLVKNMGGVKLIVVDETSTLVLNQLGMLSYALQIVHSNNEPFGGIHIVFVGDLCQLAAIGQSVYAPLGKKPTDWDVRGAKAWASVDVFVEMKTQMRQRAIGTSEDVLRSTLARLRCVCTYVVFF